jgi:hypothetical protein
MQSARMELARAARVRPPVGRRYPDLPEWVIVTNPGCHPSQPLFDLHALEVIGAQMALDASGPWEHESLMDCGCLLSVRRLADLSNDPGH